MSYKRLERYSLKQQCGKIVFFAFFFISSVIVIWAWSLFFFPLVLYVDWRSPTELVVYPSHHAAWSTPYYSLRLANAIPEPGSQVLSFDSCKEAQSAFEILAGNPRYLLLDAIPEGSVMWQNESEIGAWRTVLRPGNESPEHQKRFMHVCT